MLAIPMIGSPSIARNGSFSFASKSQKYASLRRQIGGQARASRSSDVSMMPGTIPRTVGGFCAWHQTMGAQSELEAHCLIGQLYVRPCHRESHRRASRKEPVD